MNNSYLFLEIMFVCIISIEVSRYLSFEVHTKYFYIENLESFLVCASKYFKKPSFIIIKKNLAKFAFLSCPQSHIEHLVEIMYLYGSIEETLVFNEFFSFLLV